MFISQLSDGVYYRIIKIYDKACCRHNSIKVFRGPEINVMCLICKLSVFFTTMTIVLDGNFYNIYKKGKEIVI